MSDEQKKEVPEKFKDMVASVEKLSVLDLSELVKVLEDRFGVSAAPAMMAAPMASGAAPGAASADAPTVFNVELTEGGANKIGVIKALREVTQIGLKDAKDLVDGAPKMVKEGVGKEEAETMKKKLEEAGAKVTLK